jgi:ATP-dependent helicase/nuclease subunit A
MHNPESWTNQQRRAIEHRGSDVLVAASAGTGKTSVLSERCVRSVCDAAECTDVRNMLVLTFTNAAADEMYGRIAERLRGQFAVRGEGRILGQLLLLDAADISTIDSFCRRIVGEHFFLLGLDAALRVIDGDEQRLIKAEVLQQTIDWAWQQGHLATGLGQLLRQRRLETNAAGGGFTARIIELNDFLDGVVSRPQWFERAAVLAEQVQMVQGQIAERQLDILKEKLLECRARLGYAKRLDEVLADGHWSDQIEQEFITPVEQCIEYLRKGDQAACSELIRGFYSPKLKSRPRGMSEEIKRLVTGPVKLALGVFAGLKDLAMVNPDYARLVGPAARPQTRVLIELVKEFSRRYQQAKQRLSCVDFADLEHYALELLSSRDAAGGPCPSATALRLRDRYKYILVDEYQDTSAVQQVIIERLSTGSNAFAVGDVKQCIYAWRQARPELFIDKLRAADSEPRAAGTLRVDLNRNFRSRQEILRFVNAVFSRLMTAELAGIDYDDSATLRAAAEYRPLAETCATAGDGAAVELYILDEDADEELGDEQQAAEQAPGDKEPAEEPPLDDAAGEERPAAGITPTQRQAALVARRIRKMVGDGHGRAEFTIYDSRSDCYRDVRYGDIVVLLRSLAGKVNDYAEVLGLAGIPVHCQSEAGYFAATEVSDMLSLLKVLDNPQRDIELAAVLRSPLFGLSDGELARISSFGRDGGGNFYECAKSYCVEGSRRPLRERLGRILARIEQWRSLVRRGSLAELIWRIYRQTGYLSFVQALAGGRRRWANLLKLHERAIQFEGFASARPATLGRFVEFTEKLIEEGGDYGPAEVLAAGEDAVRIMSVHKSKGLEFAVVFAAELNTPLVKRGGGRDLLADATGALGIRVIASGAGRCDCASYQVIERQKQTQELAEEMRILYVAMTRARERLILTGSERRSRCHQITYQQLAGEDRPADWQLRDCRNAMQWLVTALAREEALQDALKVQIPDKPGGGAAAEWCIRRQGGGNDGGGRLFTAGLYGPGELAELCRYLERLKSAGPVPAEGVAAEGVSAADGELIRQITDALTRRYRFEQSTAVAAKSSVSEITHREDEFAAADFGGAFSRLPRRAGVGEPGGGAGEVERRLVGSATHLLLRQLPAEPFLSAGAIRKTLDKLVEQGAIAGPAAEKVDVDSVKAFFDSELAVAAFRSGNRLRREWPFTIAVWAGELDENAKDLDSRETVIVQGIVDMVVERLDSIAIIDFKTDRVSAAAVAERARLYHTQLSLYGRAAETILKKPLAGKWVYFLAPACAVEIV